MYKSKKFRVKPWDRLKTEIDAVARIRPDIKRIFLADGHAFVLGAEKLERILSYCNESFPTLQRITAYATPQNLLNKTVGEMQRLRSLGLAILYYGVETGDPELLDRTQKGATPDEMVEGCLRAQEAGLKLSITVILGLAGREGSLRHARATADLLNRIQPRYLSALTLMLGGYEEEYRRGMPEEFNFNSPLDDISELKELLGHLGTDRCIFRTNHASNYLALKGTLMKDRHRLLEEIDRALELPERHLRGEWMRGL
ncbi:MAG: radical SAM protein [bacterium]|nr:MAG: radical SAM protein [bacterium]